MLEGSCDMVHVHIAPVTTFNVKKSWEKKKHWLYELFEFGCYKFQGIISGYFP